MGMNDAQLADFLNVTPDQLKKLNPSAEERALYDKMFEVELWDKGVGPLPEGVIVCGPKQIREGRGRVSRRRPAPQRGKGDGR